ncbi:MAG: laccase domain-containing protein [Candidatus Harrisonbacteria bacterium]|nr:laccase domain-containing protein [Candidatus Harrisonbacteria bacterium]
MKIQNKFLGLAEGNFRPQHVGEGQLSTLLRQHFNGELSRLFSPRIANGNRVIDESRSDPSEGAWLTRSAQGADGVVVSGIGSGVAMFNADCPVLALRQGDRLGVFHCALTSMLSPSILNRIPLYFDLNRVEEAIFGWGAGPCCYGLHRPPQALDRRYQVVPIKRGPRAEQTGVDLWLMAAEQLADMGLPKEVLKPNLTCTACAGRVNGDGSSGQPLYHSNLWDVHLAPEARGRNALIIWLDA